MLGFMPAVTTEGLILKRKNFGEADRMLTVLTDRYGKISVTARGVRKITSRRAGNIELLNRVKIHLFKGKSYTLTEAESIETFATIKGNLTLSTTAFHVIELIDRLVPENQKNIQLYSLVVSTLQILEKNPRQIFIRAFEVKLLTILGFWSSDAIKDLNTDQRLLLRRLEHSSWDEIGTIEIVEEQAVALENLMRYYIERTLESDLRSVKVFKQIKNE
jgi:hypothetical protein